jgi:predicted dehydrogenase/L-rhamnose mutarotase
MNGLFHVKHIALTILLKDEPGVAERYVAEHAAIWPEVEQGLRAMGIQQMRIWLLGRRLFMHMETDDGFDIARDFARYEAQTPRAGEWQRLMESLQEPAPEAQPGEWWGTMRQVFDLSDKAAGVSNGDSSMSELPPPDLVQRWPLPASPRPIVVIGAGSIVRDSHLPAYRRLGFPVVGIFDVRREAATERAAEFDLPRVLESLDEACAIPNAVFDIAVPPGEILGVLARVPAGAGVLIQKPLGRDLEEARGIRDLCREKHLTAAVNFQLRFAPNMLALRDAIDRGALGQITDIDVRINLHTPWRYWEFLHGVPRLEVLMHSIHYLDLIRAIAGEPAGVYCRGARYPDLDGFPDVRTSIILDYGDMIRCSLTLNHTHEFGPKHAASELRVEGTEAAARAKMGVNLNYPDGESDELEFSRRGSDVWTPVPLRGSWFTEAFEGPMSNLQRFLSGEATALVSPVEDALRTMAVVEACYISSASGGTPVPEE